MIVPPKAAASPHAVKCSVVFQFRLKKQIQCCQNVALVNPIQPQIAERRNIFSPSHQDIVERTQLFSALAVADSAETAASLTLIIP
jgi:hypothetical protein